MKPIHIHIEKKQFGESQPVVIQQLSLSLNVGEFLCLIGPSGTGKSTLLNIISRIDTQYEGTSTVEESATIGFIFQEPRLMPWLSVRENIELVCLQPDQRVISDMLDLVGLSGQAEKFPSQLSGGMQKRVALARAFIIKPDILLLDEPFVSLDVPSANQLRDTLENLWQQYKPTVLFVTHNLHEAIHLADRLVFLSAQPAHVILEQSIDVARPRTSHAKSISTLHDTILETCPNILSGQL